MFQASARHLVLAFSRRKDWIIFELEDQSKRLASANKPQRNSKGR